jgi:hypothetical protein
MTSHISAIVTFRNDKGDAEGGAGGAAFDHQNRVIISFGIINQPFFAAAQRAAMVFDFIAQELLYLFEHSLSGHLEIPLA